MSQKNSQQTGTTGAPVALSAQDLINGGDSPYVEVSIPSVKIGGRAGVIHFRPLSVATALQMQKDAANEDNGIEHSLGMLVRHVVTPDGKPLFDAETIQLIPVHVVQALMGAITNTMLGGGAAEAGKG
jgi:hypothetical protein